MASLYSELDRFNLLVDASPMPTAIYKGKEMIIAAANQAMLDVWGKKTSVIGKTLREALPELDGQPFHKLLDKVYTTGIPYHTKEGRADLMIDGKLKTSYYTFTYRAIKDINGKPEAIINTAADVTELVNARKQISENEEQLSFALTSAGIGTWDLDPINYTVKWDKRCRELFGFPLEGIITFDDVRDCMHPDDKKMVHQAVLAAINPKSRGQYDIRYRTVNAHNNEARWVHCKGKAYFNADNIAYRFAGTARDITEEVKARRREQQLLSLVQNNADHMTIADMDGNLIYMNQAAREMLGVDADTDVTLLSAADFYSAKELGRVQNYVIKEINEHNGWQGTVYLTNNKTKEEFPCHISYMLIKDPENGDIIGRGATAHDLRPELYARKLLADKNSELQNVIKEMEFLADSVPSVVWTSTPDGQLDYINKRWTERGAKPLAEALGMGWVDTLHPDDVKATELAWTESLKTGNPYQIEFRIRDNTGEYRWWLVRALPLKNEDGAIIKWYGTNTDITEQKELEKQKDNFLGVASHELKTPITSIKAYAQVMEMMFKRTGDVKNAALVAKMDKQVNRLNNLIGDLLDVTKINTGRLQFNYEKFDFNQMVEEVTEEVQRTTSKHIIKKQLKFTSELMGDKDRITQVVTNLLTNAIKYSPDANEIIIYTEDHGHEVQLCVQDFGIGISADKKDKVFEQFYRVSGTKEYTFPGLGLGLYISAEIVKRLNGKIWVTSVEGKGSTFCFALPIKQLD
ncbi:PAS domain-containing sensor histidine kinase [Mucilaginibacter sp.]|uniref:PAS domain-containing sensor histidine kinase n=1 Tax=Mucilaginibacter sp. TaxID=1882438 RepID=UPI003D0D0D22